MDSYKKHLEATEEQKRLHPEKYHHRCMDCGQFVKRDRWQPKDGTRHPLCWDCHNNYDDPLCL